jgi:hypothetical protein
MKNIKFLLGGILFASFFVFGASAAPAIGLAMAVSPVFDSLAAYPGKFKDELFSTLINGMDIANDVMVEEEVKSKLIFTKLTVGDGYRPFTTTEQIEGDELTYSGTELEVSPGKRELSIDIEKYRGQWMQYKKKGSGAQADENDIPFAAFTWNEVIKQVAREINNKTAYHGFDKTDATAYNDGGGTTYAAGDYVTFTVSGISHYFKCLATTSEGEDPTDTPAKWLKVNAEAVTPGLGYRLAALIAAGKVTPTATGALSATNALEKLREIWADVDEAQKNEGVCAYMSRNNYENFVRDYETKVSKYTDADGAAIRVLPGTDGKCEIKPVSWMVGSGRVIMTPKENVYLGTDLLADLNEIEVVKSTLWVMKAGIKNVIGFQFRDPAAIYCNDQV